MNLLRTAQQFTNKPVASVAMHGNGRIHGTFLVELQNGEKFILQKMHSVFSPTVLGDIERVTRHLAQKGIETTRLIPTTTDEFGYKNNNECWRALTFIPGKIFELGITPTQAESAGALVGSFHTALLDLNYEYKHKLDGFHNTPRIMKKLAEVTEAAKDTEKHRVLAPFTEEILQEYKRYEGKLDALPLRHTHRDLKLNNICFDEDGEETKTIFDLDTLGKGNIAIELGDAARSWCNKAREYDEDNAEFDMEIFRSMISGYFCKARFLTKEERALIPTGVATVTLELTARFVIDAFEESYFTLEIEHFKTRYEQNIAWARGQLALYRDFQSKGEIF